jgi:hypothetical protein
MRPSDKLLRVATGSSRLLLGSTRVSRIVSVTALFFAVCAVGATAVAPLAPDAADLPVKKLPKNCLYPAWMNKSLR